MKKTLFLAIVGLLLYGSGCTEQDPLIKEITEALKTDPTQGYVFRSFDTFEYRFDLEDDTFKTASQIDIRLRYFGQDLFLVLTVDHVDYKFPMHQIDVWGTRYNEYSLPEGPEGCSIFWKPREDRTEGNITYAYPHYWILETNSSSDICPVIGAIVTF